MIYTTRDGHSIFDFLYFLTHGKVLDLLSPKQKTPQDLEKQVFHFEDFRFENYELCPNLKIQPKQVEPYETSHYAHATRALDEPLPFCLQSVGPEN